MAALGSRAERRGGRVEFPDPVYWIWRRLTSVRFAIYLIFVTTLFALAGVIIPQVPPQLASDAVAVEQHVEAQRGTWGFFTDVLADFPWLYETNGGIFNLFNQPYWFALVAVLALAITTCTVSRFPPIWRTVRRPPKRVNDAYFERARHRFDFATPADPALVIERLRARRFKVQSEQRDGALYVFADRFQWSQLATFVSHLALIMLVLGTLLTKFGGEEFQFWLGEGQSRPLFAPGSDRAQIQVIVDDAIARFADDGQALDFRSEVRVALGGEEVAAGAVTVNGPLHAAGYRVHQAAYWEHGVALQVRNAESGQLVYSETLFLDQQIVGPRVRTSDARTGAVFAEEVVTLVQPIADIDPSLGGGYTLIPLDAGRSIALVLLPDSELGLRFFYSLLPFAADAPAASGLNTQDLGILEEPPAAPRVRVFEAGATAPIVDDVISLTERIADSSARVGLLSLPDGDRLAVGFNDLATASGFFYFNLDQQDERGVLQPGDRVALGDFTLEYLGAEQDLAQRGTLTPGETRRIGGVELAYLGAESVFFTGEDDLPGAGGEALVALERFGQARTAEEFNALGGEDVDLAFNSTTQTSSGGIFERPSRLVLAFGGGNPRLELDEGQSARVGEFEYSFLGPREFTGLNVRRDPGGTVFWIAIGLGIFGVSLTFFVPRRRIWARITPERTYIAGQAGHAVNLRREFAALAGELDETVAPQRRGGWFGDDYQLDQPVGSEDASDDSETAGGAR